MTEEGKTSTLEHQIWADQSTFQLIDVKHENKEELVWMKYIQVEQEKNVPNLTAEILGEKPMPVSNTMHVRI